MENIVLLDGERVESLVNWRDLINDIRRVLLSDAVAPMRASLTHNDVWLGAMPAAGLGLQAVKIVGVYPRNPQRNLPLVRGVMIVLREEDGEPLYLIDAATITGFRTAAATCLAITLLGYEGEEPVGLVGAGVQAWYHARCIQKIFHVNDFLIYDTDNRRAVNLASKINGRIAGLDEIHDKAKLIVTATTSKEPIIKGNLLKGNVIIASIGAPKPVVELDAEVLGKTGCILVDTIEGFKNEAGEAELVPSSTRIIDLKSALTGSLCPESQVKVYKSVGTGLFDLAAALHVHERASKP